MRFAQFNRVSRCQEESGEVTNVGLVTDIFTDIVNYRLCRPYKRCLLTVPLCFFIKITAVLGFRVGGVG